MTKLTNQELSDVLRNSPAHVMPGEYWYYKSPAGSEPPTAKCLALIIDEVETTIVTTAVLDLPERRGPFCLVRLEVVVPFNSPGFLAAVSSVLAHKSINVLLLSTFTYDYLLIRKTDRQLAIAALKDLGLPVLV